MLRYGCRFICLLLLLSLCPALLWAEEGQGGAFDDDANSGAQRPKVALVLSGGGARGAGHVGVLRVLESLRVPVDLVVGTSGGAIIGGLYASGWSPQEIEQWLEEMNWEMALSDRLPRRRLPYREKQDDERFLFDLEIGITDGALNLPKALIEGRNLSFVLEQASSRSAAIQDFDHLPIPFRAIATDLETGEKVSLGSGKLSHAIRASMAVPGIFSPVELDGRLLADGGLVDNLSVSTALDMGADVIIAVNMGARLESREALNDIFDVSGQVTSLITHRSTQDAIELLQPGDILIEPDVGDVGVLEFERSQEVARKGEAAAREKRRELAELAVGEAQFEAFLERQRRGTGEQGQLVSISINGLNRLSESRVMASINTRVNEPLVLERLQSDIGRLQRLGEIESVDFSLVEVDEGMALELTINERRQGLHHLRVGVEIHDEFDGGARYNLRIGHNRSGINRLGAEWRNEIQLGRERAVRTEFYQPLSASGQMFLSLPAHHEADSLFMYQDGQRMAEFSLRRTRAGLDLGGQIAPHGEWRMGAWRERIKSDARIGPADGASVEEDLAGWRLALNYDRLDDAEWPSEGQFLRLNWEGTRTSWSSDQVYRLARSEYAQFWSMNDTRFMLGGEWAYADSPLSFQQQPELGGPFSLSGYNRGELRGDRVVALRMLWFHQLAAADVAGRGGALYAGIGLSSGAAWQYGEGRPSDEIHHGAKLFIGADTPLGPVVFGVAQSDSDNRGLFLTLGLPLHRPRLDSSTW